MVTGCIIQCYTSGYSITVLHFLSLHLYHVDYYEIVEELFITILPLPSHVTHTYNVSSYIHVHRSYIHAHRQHG